MLRTINIFRLLFDILRPQYALNYNGTPKLNLLYRFLFGCLSPLFPKIKEYEAWCDKYYALAGNDGSCISIEAYLNEYYGQYGHISVTTAPVFDTVMYPYNADMNLGLTMYPYNSSMTGAVDMYNYGSTANSPVVKIPAGLSTSGVTYEDFIADLNALVVYGIQYSVVITN